jgi:hypothetical protein
MIALSEERLAPVRVKAGWRLPTDPGAFLAMLARSPLLGRTDAERLRQFLTFPAAQAMPESLRRELTERGVLRP